MAFADLSALARELGDRADQAADEAFNAQHALAAQERAATDRLLAAGAEHNRLRRLAAADDEGMRSYPVRPRVVHRDVDDDDDDAPESWLR